MRTFTKILSFILLSILLYSNNCYSKWNLTINPKDSFKVDFTQHSNFKSFFRDFRQAVMNNDVASVIKMTHFPFLDFAKQNNKQYGLTCLDSVEFRKKYNMIFIESVVAECINDFPKRLEDYIKPEYPSIKKEEIFTDTELELNAEYFFDNIKDQISLEFGKISGEYKLIGLKYFE